MRPAGTRHDRRRDLLDDRAVGRVDKVQLCRVGGVRVEATHNQDEGIQDGIDSGPKALDEGERGSSLRRSADRVAGICESDLVKLAPDLELAVVHPRRARG